jgi:HAD superfamily hydrolase (TIGR01509 family)
MPTGRAAGVIEACVFDLDGVLIDSEPTWEAVRRGLVDERGGTWPADAQRRLMGMNTAEWAGYLSRDLGVGWSPERVAEVVVDRMAERYRQRLPLMPGAAEAVRRLAGRWPLGLASSSPRRLIDAVLAAAGLRECFTATISTDEVGRGKPAPDVYRAVAARLGVPPSGSAAVEDSTNGLRSATAAGMRAIAVPHPRYPVDPDVLAVAAVVLDDLSELTVDVVESVGLGAGG